MIPDWLNDMPSAWTSVPFGSIFTQSKRKNSRLQRDFVLSVMKDRGVIPYTEKGNVGNKVSEDLSGYKLVDKGDFVLNSMNLYMGSVGVSEYDGVTSTAYIVCKPKENVFVGYYNYLIQFKGFQEYVGFLGKGIMEIREAVRWTALKSVFVPLPDLPTQRAIADFLDRETARIDSLIEKKQRLVELLGEKRCAVITASVTDQSSVFSEPPDGGDSRSAEGGGEVSSLSRDVFESAPLRRHIEKTTNGTTATQIEEGDSTQRVTRIETISTGEVNLGKTGFVDSDENLSQFALEEGDILFSHINSMTVIGNSALVNAEVLPLYVGMNLLRLRPSASADSKFLAWCLKSTFVRHQIRQFAKPAINQASISTTNLKRVKAPLPDLPTQRAIADFLDRETARINSLIEKTKKSINRLKEYRSALITSAVTGQIDVSAHTRSGTNDRQLDAIQSEMQA